MNERRSVVDSKTNDYVGEVGTGNSEGAIDHEYHHNQEEIQIDSGSHWR